MNFQTLFWLCTLGAALFAYFQCRTRPWRALFVLPTAALFPLIIALLEFRSSDAFDSSVKLQIKIATVVVLVAALFGLHVGGFKFHFFPPWGASKK